jgi:hypothetical protein
MAHSLLMFKENSYFLNEEDFSKEVHFLLLLPSILHFQVLFKVVLHVFNLFITFILLAAFVMLSLVIVAFAEVVGWVTLGVVCCYGVIYIYLWGEQLWQTITEDKDLKTRTMDIKIHKKTRWRYLHEDTP